MITNATTFIHDLHQILRGAATQADTDMTKTIKTVSHKLRHTQSSHYLVSRWRSNDACDHEFTFQCNADQTYTYLSHN